MAIVTLHPPKVKYRQAIRPPEMSVLWRDEAPVVG
jgi:hypothetical protein